jgi:hypothetical protein
MSSVEVAEAPKDQPRNLTERKGERGRKSWASGNWLTSVPDDKRQVRGRPRCVAIQGTFPCSLDVPSLLPTHRTGADLHDLLLREQRSLASVCVSHAICRLWVSAVLSDSHIFWLVLTQLSSEDSQGTRVASCSVRILSACSLGQAGATLTVPSFLEDRDLACPSKRLVGCILALVDPSAHHTVTHPHCIAL